jgi:ribulose-phosphate 3-epimerase
MPLKNLVLELGVKTDPIEYRYSYEWLFRLLKEEGIRHVQLGSFFELYQLPNEFFLDLRKKAEKFEIRIESLFTAHRELGGFFREESGFVTVARKNYERYIEVGALLGASSVGSNPGAVVRDKMEGKLQRVGAYLSHMKQLLFFAKDRGVSTLTIEPMSCLAEPPTLPSEMEEMARELSAFQKAHPKETAGFGFCVDVAHGYADRHRNVVHDHWELMKAALPHTTELHLKNTDGTYNSTFGFSHPDRARGIIDIAEVRDFYRSHSEELPVQRLVGYLEIGGPKLGRDYSDPRLEADLRESLQHLKEVFLAKKEKSHPSPPVAPEVGKQEAPAVRVAPSMMCADLLHLAENVRALEKAGADILHLDIMDTVFAPNMPLGLEILKRLRTITDLPFDVHLMVVNNSFFIKEFARIGAQMVSVHAESTVHLDRTLDLIRSRGMEAGVALNPATPLSTLDHVLDKLDFVLIMTVNPGYAGQKLVPETLRKISDCRAYLEERDCAIPIEVDGNVSFENIPKMVAAGADILVAGTSSLFCREGSASENMTKTREAIESGLVLRRETRKKVAQPLR